MNKSLLVIGVFIIIAIIFLVLSRFLYNPFSFVVQSVFSPILYQTYRLKVHFLGDVSEIEKLKKENATLAQKIIDQENLKKDVEALRSQFDNSPVATTRLVPVEIVGAKGLILSPDSLIIHAGSRSGMKAGMTVIYEENLIGIIQKVTTEYSQIVLPTNHEFSAFVKTADSDMLGVVSGQGDFILLDNIAVSGKLEKGMHVLTKGEQHIDGTGLPPDLIIGKIESVNKIENRPLQSARLAPLIEYAKLKKVFVIEDK